MRSFPARLRALVLLIAAISAVGLLGTLPARADTAPLGGVPATVSTDPLPTVQINGVVWSQVVVGNTVYVGGNFANARPAGAAAGSNTTARANVLAFNLTTGALITGFVANTNAEVRSIAAAPDGSRIYIAGSFTTVNGTTRNRVAALNPTTGAVISTFAPSFNTTVEAVKATNTTVYAGGNFTAVSGQTRTRGAAVAASSGAVQPFAPDLEGGRARALVLSPDASKVVFAGSFATLNGSGNPGFGMGAVNASTGASLPWHANSQVRNAGPNAAVWSLSSDSDSVYGTAYNYGGTGTLEGWFRADWVNGDLVWAADCHGDTYSAFPYNGAVYVAGHSHYCTNVGGFPQTAPTWTFQRGIASTKAWNGNRNLGQTLGYPSWEGVAAPDLLDWWPDFNTGTASGAGQGPWSVTAGGSYVVYGGEFTRVDNQAQQGLVRFAVSSVAPNKDGPRLSGSGFVPTLSAPSAGTVRISWAANYDRDNQFLTYRIYRDGNTTTPITTTTVGSRIWFDRPTTTYTDSGLAGGSHSYRLRVDDPFGNTAWGDSVSITVAGGAGNSPPSASFTNTTSNLTASFTSTSTDSDGTIATSAWQFGDGATGSGTTVNHTYATAGTRTVTLTVTDNGGATATTTKSVTVGNAPPAVLASDEFARNTTGGWGTAPAGGAWSLSSGTTSAYSTDGSVGRLTSAAAAQTFEAYLPAATTTSADVRATVATSPVTAGGSVYLSLIGRRIGTADYRARAVFSVGGAITLQLNRSGTTVASGASGLVFASGDRIQLRLQVTGTSPTTLRVKAWKSGTAEPSAWGLTFSDSTAGLQTAGHSGVGMYVGSSVTSLPMTATFDDFSLATAG